MPTEASKLFTQCAALYEQLLEESTTLEGEDVWSGRIMDTVKMVGIPLGGYKRVIDRLIEMHCIDQVSRGARGEGNLTTFVLRYPPTEEVWDAFVNSSRPGLTGSPSLATVSAQVKEIQQNIGGMDIREAFKELENRIKSLSDRLTSLEHNN